MHNLKSVQFIFENGLMLLRMDDQCAYDVLDLHDVHVPVMNALNDMSDSQRNCQASSLEHAYT